MNKLIVIFGSVILFLSVNSDVQRKQIRQGDFDIECYVYIKKLKSFNKEKEYYWFKSGEVHNSYANAGGLVLHYEYKKFYRSKQLAEHGFFNYGLKDGQWRDWHENGKIKSVTDWSNGYKSGKYYLYEENGEILISGSFKKGVKSNTWINYKTADTTYYKNDSVYSEKPKSRTSKFISKIFKKRDSVEVAKKKKERLERRRQDSIRRSIKRLERKERRREDSITKIRNKKE